MGFLYATYSSHHSKLNPVSDATLKISCVDITTSTHISSD